MLLPGRRLISEQLCTAGRFTDVGGGGHNVRVPLAGTQPKPTDSTPVLQGRARAGPAGRGGSETPPQG